MTFFAADPISSGRPYRVLAAGGQAPSTLDQFLGEASFTIAKDGAESLVSGLGSPHEAGVRFHEKNVAHDGKDVRVWQISQDSSGAFVATATAAF
jgi:hypothetical protein